MSWDKITLGSIADIFSGYAFKSADMNAEYGTPLLKIKNISSSRVSTECDTFLNVDFDLSKYSRFLLREDDFLVAMTGQGKVVDQLNVAFEERIDRSIAGGYVNFKKVVLG